MNIFNKDTEELLNQIKKTKNIDPQDFTFSKEPYQMLNDYILENNLKKSYIAKKSNQTSNFYSICDGTNRKPSRDKLIATLIAMNCDIYTTNRFLKIFKFCELYTKDRRDLIIYFGVIDKLSILDINYKLEKSGFEPLCVNNDKGISD